MADYSNMAMSQADISNLKDTLCAQQNLLQKLYNELDAEREASATAASEALNVILRLQGEKAAVKMEAEQYKRLAEEKMCHAEESFAIIEDIICQKEMELASLDYQVQAYRYKLVSMGCVDPGGGEIKFPENLLVRSDNLSPETGFCNNIGRRNSAPNMGRYKKGLLIEKEGPTSPDINLSPKIVEREIYEKPENSYSDEIKRLNEKVKEIAGVNYLSARSSPSLSSRTSLTNLQNELRSPSPSLITNDQNKVPIENENLLKKDVGIDVLDVFEVPQADETVTKEKKLKTGCGDIVHDPEDHVKMCAKEMPDWLKKLMQSNYREKRPISDHVASNNADNVSESQVNGISEIVEAEEGTNRDEELKLLKEIKDQIISLQDEIRRNQNVMKSYIKKETSFSPLPEAMLHFWL